MNDILEIQSSLCASMTVEALEDALRQCRIDIPCKDPEQEKTRTSCGLHLYGDEYWALHKYISELIKGGQLHEGS